MSIYYNKQIPGQLWLRNLTDKVVSASDALSSVFVKYKTINSSFYSDLTSNNINRFDVIYDTIFVETNNGYIFDKFYIDDFLQVQPYNQLDLFSTRKNTTVDYWYSESKKKIYFTEIFYTAKTNTPANVFTFNLIINEFDCTTGIAVKSLLKSINLKYTSSTNWDINNFTIENPKITYNSDTKIFNISFILRNSASTFGMISINVDDGTILAISEINGFLPYFTLDLANCSIQDWSPVGSIVSIPI